MTVVAEVVAQWILGDIVALTTHQFPIHLGEEGWGEDTYGERGIGGRCPQGRTPPSLGDASVPTSPPTERKSRAELTPADRLLKRCS